MEFCEIEPELENSAEVHHVRPERDLHWQLPIAARLKMNMSLPAVAQSDALVFFGDKDSDSSKVNQPEQNRMPPG